MDSNAIFRKAAAKDLDQISNVDKAAFGTSSYPRFFIRQAFDVFGSLLEVAELDSGNLAGYTLGAVNTDNSEEGWIISLAVRPENKNKGIGKSLTEIILKRLLKRGVKSISLTVRPDNNDAIVLYERLGFETQKYDEKYFGEGEGRLLMVYRKRA